MQLTQSKREFIIGIIFSVKAVIQIDHVGSRMKQVETLMADYQEVPVRVISNEKAELTRLRDEGKMNSIICLV